MLKKRNLARWVIEGEHLRHDKAWSKDPDNLTCGWATKAPKRLSKEGWLKNWHCSKCRKRAPKEIQFAADLAFVKEKPTGLQTYSSLGHMLNVHYNKTFIKEMQNLTPMISVLKATTQFKTKHLFSFPVKK